METSPRKDLESAHAQTQETLKQLAAQAAGQFTKNPVDGLREVRSFLRGVYHGHRIILNHGTPPKAIPPEEQDELAVVDAQECRALLAQYSQADKDSRRRVEIIASEYAHHRLRIRLCLADSNHKPTPDASVPRKKDTPPPIKDVPPSSERKPAPAGKTAVRADKPMHKTPEAPLVSPEGEVEDTDFEFTPADDAGQQSPDGMSWEDLGIEEAMPPARGQKKAGRKP